jgi:hypothetical protein
MNGLSSERMHKVEPPVLRITMNYFNFSTVLINSGSTALTAQPVL